MGGLNNSLRPGLNILIGYRSDILVLPEAKKIYANALEGFEILIRNEVDISNLALDRPFRAFALLHHVRQLMCQ